MLEIFQKVEKESFCGEDDVIMLDHIQREKGRLKVQSEKGEEVRIFIERGDVLLKDEMLKTTCKRYIRVKLAKEPVVVAKANDWKDFSRACYHLGNRHVRLQIGELWLRFIEDPVLIDLVNHLGLDVSIEEVEFEPEPGAYGHGFSGKSGHNHH